jgi:DNA-binding NtrC family response regulator
MTFLCGFGISALMRLFMQPARILIADDRRVLPVLEAAFCGYELIMVTRLAEAERLVLEDGIDMFIIGVHFDDSRATELVKFIRSQSAHAETPIMIVKLLPSGLPHLVRRSMEMMKLVKSISEYLELDADLHAEGKIRASAEKYLPLHKVVAGTQ